MKFLATLILVVLFASVVLAEDGNQGSGGRGYNGDVRTVTVKGGITTEDGDPPPPPPCVPSATVECGGNQGSGGREASVSIMIFVQKYVIGFFV
jgi:hypothetical protein